MANNSIYAAFERMWQHINTNFDKKGSASQALVDAKAYTDSIATKFIVNITTEDMENWTSDKTFEEIMIALQNGNKVEASFMGLPLPLIVANDSMVVFQKLSMTEDGSALDNYTAVISEGNIINMITQNAALSENRVMVVNITKWANRQPSADKTYAEIVEAMNSGTLVYGRYDGIWGPAILCGNFGYGNSVMFQLKVILQGVQNLATIYVLETGEVIVEQIQTSSGGDPMIVEFTLKEGYYEEWESNATANKTFEEIIEAINNKRDVIGLYDGLLLNFLQTNETKVVFHISPMLKYDDVMARTVIAEISSTRVYVDDNQFMLATTDGYSLTSDIHVDVAQIDGLTSITNAEIDEICANTLPEGSLTESQINELFDKII